MSYLLDTCILSKLRKIKKKPDEKLENWITKHSEMNYFISVLTIGEIQSGISELNIKKESERQKKNILEDWFFEELIPRFNGRILSIDMDVIFVWGKLFGENKKRGVTIPLVDSLIAATALVHNLAIVTENTKDFIETGARIFNPWA